MTNNFNVDTYDFDNDLEFQEFLENKLPKEYIEKEKYIRIIISCKKDWIKWLNSTEYRLQQIKKHKEENEKY